MAEPFHAPQGPYSAEGRPGPAVAAPAPPRADERWRARTVEALPGTGFALVQLEVPPVTSGLAVGGLIAGVAGVLASTLVLCFGLTFAGDGTGLWVGGAFALLAGLFSLAGLGLGLGARRQIARSGSTGRIRFTGRGVAIAALVCGAAGLLLTVLALALTAVVQFS